jgi:hypothetical protein
MIDRNTDVQITDEALAFAKPLLCPVIFEGRKFFGIREFNCHSVGLFTEKTLQVNHIL